MSALWNPFFQWRAFFVRLALAGLFVTDSTAAVQPLPAAHSHNDYEQDRPLLKALDHGFCSVEADVWLVDGELRVAHDLDQTQGGRTLESLYLKPLHERVHANGGRVHPNGPVFTLLIDFKSAADPTYEALKTALAKHESMLCRFGPDGILTNAVMVIVSGNRPIETMTGETNRLAALDGRMTDLNNLPPVALMPLISDNWNGQFAWRGEGAPGEPDLTKLSGQVAAVHAAGRRLRYWASPDATDSWKLQRDAGVDLINTDHLAELAAFLQAAE